MDLSRAVYSRDLKITAMRALDAGARTGEIARKYQLSPKLLERWRGEWRARGEAAFPGIGHRGAGLPALDDARRIADLERKPPGEWITVAPVSRPATPRTLRDVRPHANHGSTQNDGRLAGKKSR